MKTIRVSQIIGLLAFLQAHSIVVQSTGASTLPITISYSDKQIHFTNDLCQSSSKLTLSLIDGQANTVLKSSSENGNTLVASLPDSSIQISRSRPREGDHHLQEYVFVWSPVLDEKKSLKPDNSDRSANKKKVCLDYVPDKAGAYVYPTALSAKASTTVFNYPMRQDTQSFTSPFVSGYHSVASIVDRLFFLSTGAALLLDDLHPWAVSVNVGQKGTLCFYLDYGQQPFNSPSVTHPRAYFSIKFRLLLGGSLKSVWQAAVGHLGYIRRPKQTPKADLFHTPIYPAFPFYEGENANYHRALENLFQCLEKRPSSKQTAVLFLDDSIAWQKITDQNILKGLDDLAVKLKQTKQRKYQLAIWMNPIIWGSAACDESWLMYPAESGKYALDFTNLQAQRFLLNYLASFRQESPFTRFFFSDGQLETFTGKNPKKVSQDLVLKTPNDPVVGKYPSFLTTLYGQTIGHFQPYSGAIDGAFKMQSLPTFIRLKIDFERSEEDSIKQLLSQALVLATAGYQFILPELSNLRRTPEGAEGVLLFKRWTQAVTFFPVMTILEIGRKRAEKETIAFINSTAASLALREKIVNPLIGELLSDWTERGEPLFRPMWYAAAYHDTEEVHKALYQIDDQFMLGENLVVAPIVQLKETQRDVYLPAGTWVNGLNGSLHKGPGPIKQFSVSTEQLLYFTRL